MAGRHHQEQRAQQQFVGNRVQVFAQLGLLMQQARRQPVQPIAQSGDHQQDQRRVVAPLHDADGDEGNKEQPHQRQLVRRVQNSFFTGSVPRRHAEYLFQRASCLGGKALRPAKAALPRASSSSMRSTRCMGKNAVEAMAGSPARICRARSSSDSRATPRSSTPAGASRSSTPTHFCRGECSVSSTTEPSSKPGTQCLSGQSPADQPHAHA